MSILPDQPSRPFKTVDRNKYSRTNDYSRTHPHCHARTTHATKSPAIKETSISQIQLLNVQRDTPGEAQLKQCSSLVFGQVVSRVGRAQCVEGRIEPAHRHEVQQSLATKGTKSSPKHVPTVKWQACVRACMRVWCMCVCVCARGIKSRPKHVTTVKWSACVRACVYVCVLGWGCIHVCMRDTKSSPKHVTKAKWCACVRACVRVQPCMCMYFKSTMKLGTGTLRPVWM